METMTTEHTRWDEFCERLGGPEGCNFRDDKEKGTTWHCGGGTDKSFAEIILQDMGDVDVTASLSYFEDHGGYCDCEILFNVAS